MTSQNIARTTFRSTNKFVQKHPDSISRIHSFRSTTKSQNEKKYSALFCNINRKKKSADRTPCVQNIRFVDLPHTSNVHTIYASYRFPHQNVLIQTKIDESQFAEKKKKNSSLTSQFHHRKYCAILVLHCYTLLHRPQMSKLYQ